jgi:hypothetical protein
LAFGDTAAPEAALPPRRPANAGMCLYSVLSHVHVSSFNAIFAEIARVTLAGIPC